jgi:serine/threonine-protein kinase
MGMNRTLAFGYRLIVAACASFALAGCTTGLGGVADKPSAVEPSFKLDGIYKFVEDGTGTRNGVAIDNLFKGETQWAFRTTCDENGCVAAGAKFDPAKPTVPASAAFAADYVDGKWTQVTITGGVACPRENGETYQSDQWSIWDISQTPDKQLALNITNAATNSCNYVSQYTPAISRVGELPKDFPLTDPAEAPKRADSFPATGFRGKYTVDYKVAATGEPQPGEHMDVKTICLRTGERCVTTAINVDPRDPGTPYSLQVYEFAQDKFTFDNTIGKKPCQDGREGIASQKALLNLPPAPVPDPLTTVTGQSALIFTGDCSGTVIYDSTFTRTGD